MRTLAEKYREITWIINPNTGRPFVYMSKRQAIQASKKRGGEPLPMNPNYRGSGYALANIPQD